MPGEAEVFPTDQFRADPLLQLLTDALRDGPGSPSWHAAMQRLNEMDASGAPNARSTAGQYRRLCDAREHLESGREFRSIRPGPAFTAKLWTKLDAQGTRSVWKSRGLLTAIAAACVLVGCVAVIWQMIPRGSSIDRETAALSSMLFTRPLASLDSATAAEGDWRAIGASPLVGLALPADDHRAPPTGGGIELSKPVNADTAFAIEVKFQIKNVSADLVPEVAISDIDDFSAATATSPHELLFALEGKQAKVVSPNGRLVAQTDLPGDGRGELTVRLRIDRQAVIVEMNGRTVYAGDIGLLPTSDRHVAVRLVRRGANTSPDVVLRSIQALVAQ